MIDKDKLTELIRAEQEENAKRIIVDEFRDRTNRKNLHFQIQQYVKTAKANYQEKLDERRHRLRILLLAEDKAYEEEFINKLKTKVEDSIRERTESLMALKTQKAKEHEEFVKKKRIQQYMNNCDEIRLELRNNLLRESKHVQLAQMKENRQKEQLQREEDCLWLAVRRRIEEEQDKNQKYEDCLKRRLNEYDRDILQGQILHQKQMKEMERLEGLELRKRNEELLKAELEGAANAEEKERIKKREQGALLRAQRQEQIRQKNILLQQDAYYECRFNEEINRQKEHEEKILKTKESRMKESILRYLEYLNEMKKEYAIQQKNESEALALYQTKIECEKMKGIQAMKLKKQNEAKKAHQELLQQICDNEERKIKQARAEYESALVQREIHERKLREERAKELTRMQAAKDYGRELCKQIEEIRRFEADEKRRFEEDLRKAALEENHCVVLAKKYIEENIDYLPPHPNWRLISCPCIKEN